MIEMLCKPTQGETASTGGGSYQLDSAGQSIAHSILSAAAPRNCKYGFTIVHLFLAYLYDEFIKSQCQTGGFHDLDFVKATTGG
jgi:hypothetical protein